MDEGVTRQYRNEQTGDVPTLSGLPPLLGMSSFVFGTGWASLGPEVWLYPEQRLEKTSSRVKSSRDGGRPKKVD